MYSIIYNLWQDIPLDTIFCDIYGMMHSIPSLVIFKTRTICTRNNLSRYLWQDVLVARCTRYHLLWYLRQEALDIIFCDIYGKMHSIPSFMIFTARCTRYHLLWYLRQNEFGYHPLWYLRQDALDTIFCDIYGKMHSIPSFVIFTAKWIRIPSFVIFTEGLWFFIVFWFPPGGVKQFWS
jgi:hypothetical protein